MNFFFPTEHFPQWIEWNLHNKASKSYRGPKIKAFEAAEYKRYRTESNAVLKGSRLGKDYIWVGTLCVLVQTWTNQILQFCYRCKWEVCSESDSVSTLFLHWAFQYCFGQLGLCWVRNRGIDSLFYTVRRCILTREWVVRLCVLGFIIYEAREKFFKLYEVSRPQNNWIRMQLRRWKAWGNGAAQQVDRWGEAQELLLCLMTNLHVILQHYNPLVSMPLDPNHLWNCSQ